MTWSDGKTPNTAFGSIECRICAASAMAGAVFRCAGSAMICDVRHLRQLPHDLIAHKIVGQYPDPFRRNHGRQTVDCGLNQCALASYVEHLFGVALAAARPESRTPAAGQNQAVIIRLRHLECPVIERGRSESAAVSRFQRVFVTKCVTMSNRWLMLTAGFESSSVVAS